MRSTHDCMQASIRAGQKHVELVPFSVSVIRFYIFAYGVSTVIANVVSFANVETGAHATFFLCVVLLCAFLLTYLTLTGLARLSRLRSLVGLMTRLATNTA